MAKLLRMVLNPFKPAKIPYMSAPYEFNPYSFFGVGLQRTWMIHKHL